MDVVATSLPKRVVGGRMPVTALLVYFSDGRVLQGLGNFTNGYASGAYQHALWRAEQNHETDAGKDWFSKDWPTSL